MGSIVSTDGKAMNHENIHAENHSPNWKFANPTLIIVLTNDTIHDMLNERKKGTKI